MLYAVNEFTPAARRRDGRRPLRVRYRTVGDANLTAAVESDADTRREGHRRDRGRPDHRARRHPRRRQGQRSRHGRPQAGGLLLMPSDMLRFATAGSRRRRQEHADRPAAVRHQGDVRGPARGGRAGQPATAATTTPTSRCSPTACAPSASRASRSTSPTATSPRPQRKFIIADTPGHIQYTRNMVTGASTADLALVLRRRPQGHRRAEPAARVPRHAARRAAPRAVRQQDGPGRLRRGGLRGDPRRVQRRSRRGCASPT